LTAVALLGDVSVSGVEGDVVLLLELLIVE
jgi:hypothetical protein